MAITPEKRSTLVHLLNIGTSNNPSWAFINEGVTELTEEFNPDTNDLQYIGEDNATTYIRKYAPSVSLTAVVLNGDSVNAWLQSKVNTLPVGSEADTQYIRFSLLEPIATSETNTKKYIGYLRNASVSVDSIGGSAGEDIEISATLNGRGEQQEGVVTATLDSTGKVTKWEFSTSSSTVKLTFLVNSGSPDNTPIQGATVKLCTGGTKITGENGKAEFTVSPSDSYLYSISASGKTTKAGEVAVTSTDKEETVSLSNS